MPRLYEETPRALQPLSSGLPSRLHTRYKEP